MKKTLLHLLCISLILAGAFPARALTIIRTDDLSVAANLSAADKILADAAFDYAAAQICANFSDNITIRITLKVVAGTGTLSASVPTGMTLFSYPEIGNALVSHATTPDDTTAVNSLPGTDPTGARSYNITTAEAKALGLATYSLTDGTMTFGAGFSYTYDQNNRAISGKYDFIGIAMHEITEIMGRNFGLGRNLSSDGGPNYVPFDLFRFTGNGVRGLTQGNGVYFSINGGATNLKSFHFPNGTATDPMDWAAGTNDSFNAQSATGVKLDLSTVDLQVMDVIGYNRIFVPTVTTPTSASIASTSATLGGNVTGSLNATVTERGVVYSITTTNGNPVIGGTGVTKVTSAGTTGVFTVNASGLSAGTGYSFKAYATNSLGTTYTSVSTFNTPVGTTAPTVTTPTSASITATTATLGGNVTGNGGATVTELGVVYSVTTTNGNPVIGGAGVTKVTGTGTAGVFTVNVSGLSSNAGYSFKAYATNSVGTTYTSVATFTTATAVTAPIFGVGNFTLNGYTTSSATLSAYISGDGGAAITERGIVYSVTSVNSNPLLGGSGVTKVTNVGTTGFFRVIVTGLATGTTYSFNAYATNSVGTTYCGPVLSRTTSTTVTGQVDTTYLGSVSGSFVLATADLTGGKTIIGGLFSSVGGVACSNIARLFVTGAVDSAYLASADNQVYCLALQPDGKMLAGGLFTTMNGTGRSRIARLNINGGLDTTFTPGAGADGEVDCIVLQPDGKILISGNFSNYNNIARPRIARLNADGTLDTTFTPPGTGANNAVFSMALQADGKIVIGGNFDAYNGTPRSCIARLNADGTLDTSFNPGTGASTGFKVNCVCLQPDGKVLLGGDFSNFNGAPLNCIARLNADGSVDANFNPGTGPNMLFFSTFVNSISLQADGKILIGGSFNTFNALPSNYFARLTSNGSLEANSTFDNGTGADNIVYSLATQSTGKTLLGGAFSTVNGVAASGLARLNNDPATAILKTPTLTQIQWRRGGASSEVSSTTFELSTDGGSTYTMLGAGTRISGGWQLTGLSLPIGGTIRARGRTMGGSHNGSSGIVQQVSPVAFSAVADMNNDGNADILLQNNQGQVAVWYMDGAGHVTSGGYLSAVGGLGDWRVVGIADMNSDGNADTLLQNTQGQVAVWYMDGAGHVTSGGYLSAVGGLGDWHVVGVGDMNSDGNADILLQNSQGQVAVWYMDGAGHVTSGGYLSAVGGLGDWHVVGVGDMNSDGNADILLQNSQGQVAVWYMDGAGHVTSGGYLSAVGGLGDWRVFAVNDMNNDGNPDILLQNSQGQVAVWYMDGAGHVTSGGYLSAAGGLGDWRAH